VFQALRTGSIVRLPSLWCSTCLGKESMSSGATAQPGETAEGWKGECRARLNYYMEYWDYVQCNMLCNSNCKLKQFPFQRTEGVSLLKKKKKKSLENKHFS